MRKTWQMTPASRPGRALLKALGFMVVLAALSGRAMAHGAPEIDPGSAASALTLLTGGVLLLTTRKRLE